MGLEEVMSAKGDEGTLLLANASMDQRFEGCGQIVITETMRDASEELEGLHMSVEEGFLLLSRKGHHKGSP